MHTVWYFQVLLFHCDCLSHFLDKSKLKNTFGTITKVLELYMTRWLIGSGLSNHPLSLIRTRIDCSKSSEHSDCRVTYCSATMILSWSIVGHFPLRLCRGTVGIFCCPNGLEEEEKEEEEEEEEEETMLVTIIDTLKMLPVIILYIL